MRISIMFFVVFIFSSCSNNTYQQYYSFNDNHWHSDSLINYKYNIVDTIKSYTLSLNIRHTTDYKFQNLFIFLDGYHKDTVEIILANKNGKWLGSGISNIRNINYVFDDNRVFSKKGEYKLSVEQAMRYGAEEKIKKLEHIVDIGLIISEKDE